VSLPLPQGCAAESAQITCDQLHRLRCSQFPPELTATSRAPRRCAIDVPHRNAPLRARSYPMPHHPVLCRAGVRSHHRAARVVPHHGVACHSAPRRTRYSKLGTQDVPQYSARYLLLGTIFGTALGTIFGTVFGTVSETILGTRDSIRDDTRYSGQYSGRYSILGTVLGTLPDTRNGTLSLSLSLSFFFSLSFPLSLSPPLPPPFFSPPRAAGGRPRGGKERGEGGGRE